MEIIETKPEERSFHLFEEVPKHLYPAEFIPHKQTELINEEFLQTCYVVMEHKVPKARLALYDNPHLTYEGSKAVCIGNYESVDDHSISKKLIQHAVSKAKSGGAEFVIGPMNGSTWDSYRFSLHHRYSNFLLEPYHHLYYNEHFVENGFHVISSYRSSIDHAISCRHEELAAKEAAFVNKGVTIRNMNMNQYDRELEKLYPFISTVFKNNFLYTPISWKTFKTKYSEASAIIQSKYVLIAEDKQNQIIGFIFSYRDLFNQRLKSLVIKTLARDPGRQWAGLGHVLFNRVICCAKADEYRSVVHAFMREGGTSTAVSTTFAGLSYKNYVLYGRSI